MTHEDRLNTLEARATLLREYAGSERNQDVVALLDALMTLYLDDLCSVSANELERLQGAVAQVKELRKLLSGVKTNGRL